MGESNPQLEFCVIGQLERTRSSAETLWVRRPPDQNLENMIPKLVENGEHNPLREWRCWFPSGNHPA